jgi:hypothetical protein
MYGADTKALFRRAKGEHNLEPVAIWLGGPTLDEKVGLVCLPTDACWDGAKTFSVHGGVHYKVLDTHPMIHFPMDTVNGLTKNHRFIPVFNSVRDLLMPHFRLTLSLEDAVMNDWILSILLNPYFLHCLDTKAATKIFYTAMDGWKTYNFQDMRNVFKGPYDRQSRASEFVDSYRPAYTTFISDIVAAQPVSNFLNEHTASWATEVASFLPGFPHGDNFNPKKIDMHDAAAVETALTTLKDTLMNIMFDLSVVHAFDHYGYATQIPLNKAPWRLRAPAPRSRNEAWDFQKGSATYYDYFLFYVVNKVFFFFGPWDSMGNVDYGFADSKLQGIQQVFKLALWQNDKSLETAGRQEMPLSKIGPSIDY